MNWISYSPTSLTENELNKVLRFSGFVLNSFSYFNLPSGSKPYCKLFCTFVMLLKDNMKRSLSSL